MRPRMHAPALALGLALVASPALAQWPTTISDNLVLDAPSSSLKSYPHFCTVPSGSYLVWQDLTLGVANVQRGLMLGLDGMPASGWDASGVVLPIPANTTMITDGVGGFYSTWASELARFEPDGTPAPGWPAGGVALPGEGVRVAPDGAGSVFVLWLQVGSQSIGLHVQRFLDSGVPAAGWFPYLAGTADGSLRLGGGALIPDGAGGAFVSWLDSQVHVMRLGPDGLPAPGWGLHGIAMGDSAGYLNADGDGQGGLYLEWRKSNPVSGATTLFLQRVTGGGQVAAGWPSGGLALTPPVNPFAPINLFTGADGSALVFFLVGTYGDRGTWAQRIASDGTVAPGWPSGGRALTPGTSVEAALATAVTADGDLIVATEEWPPTPFEVRFTARRFGADGLPAPGWTADGVVLADFVQPTIDGSIATVNRPSVLTDAQGVALLAWDWADVQPLIGELYVKRMRADGTLGADAALAVGPPAPARLALAAPWPNPAPGRTTLAFTLPASGRATLAIYDVSGRRVRTLADGVLAAGAHTLTWDGRADGDRALPAGLYLVRLETAAGAAVRRVALLP